MFRIGEVSDEQENALQMLKAITSVVQIQSALSRRNPEFDLGNLEIYDFSDLVDILGSAC